MTSARISPLDRERLLQALALAEQAIGVSEPNPRVGCVIGWADGRILGCGSTQEFGGPHAEVMALRDARRQGHALRGATAWVTLEPCAHQGLTPPCCDALIEAGVAHVVIATGDPFDQVNGRGIARLRAAGIEVTMADADLAEAAKDLNIGFFSRVQRQRPWVRMKIAASLDGRTALMNGVSQWITGPEARADGHRWRRRAGAILTGIGTVKRDDPRLDVRLVDSRTQPLRVVVDSGMNLSPDARVLAPPGRALVVTATGDPTRARALQDRGAEVLVLDSGTGQVDLGSLLEALADRSVNELHVEAGATLNGALLRAGLVDELLVYLAPKLLGPGIEMASLAPLTAMPEGLYFAYHHVCRFGPDLRLVCRRCDGAAVREMS